MSETLLDQAARAVERAQALGAAEVRASTSRQRAIHVSYRDGAVEQIEESTSSSLSVALYVDGRYSEHGTNDLRPEALDAFLARAIDLTRLLAPDPHRALPEPSLYEGRPDLDLDLFEPDYEAQTTEARVERARVAWEAARAVEGPIISATASTSDTYGESARVTSNGFSGEQGGTQFWVSVEVSVQDEDGRRPEAYDLAGGRRVADVSDPAAVGAEAARRALARLGQRKGPSGRTTLVVDPRAGGRLLGTLLGAMTGSAAYKKSTFLLGREGEAIGSELLTLVDDPLVPGGLGSRLYDGDGMPSRRRTLVSQGRLEELLLGVYYARKLGRAPQGGGLSNLSLRPGERSQAEIIAGIDRGILVTGFMGGNSDGTQGDFSHGVRGFEILGGELAGPVGEMNADGNHCELWHRLVEVGDDPYRFSSRKTPTLVFEGVEVSGL